MTVKPRIGMWLIGARGGVASTTIVGLIALKKGLVQSQGLVSQLPQFAHLPLPAWGDLVVGGHEIRCLPLRGEALRLATEMRVVSPDLIAQCGDELDEIDGRIRPGTSYGVGPTIAALADADLPRDETPQAAIQRIQRDLREFSGRHALEHVIVVNVSSTEPRGDVAALPTTWDGLQPLLLARAGGPLKASSLYAIAALDLGYSYINFTPSLGASVPAIDELARLRGSRHTGCDGKTGETLLKSVLAPMFARRHLEVMSWVGHNIFGNMDGHVLNDPANKQSKIASKDHLISDILGYAPQTLVSIEYIKSLGDWKTAWDHIHFAGFLGAPMVMQFIWQGCDSLLAAPLVLDLVRFTEAARIRGDTGVLRFLASFFKSPLAVTENRFEQQFGMLEEWAGGTGH